MNFRSTGKRPSRKIGNVIDESLQEGFIPLPIQYKDKLTETKI